LHGLKEETHDFLGGSPGAYGKQISMFEPYLGITIYPKTKIEELVLKKVCLFRNSGQ